MPFAFSPSDLYMPVDFHRLAIVAETEQELSSFLGIFFQTAEDIVSEMQMAQQCGALTQWKDAAHKLRGAAANTGMAGLEKACRESETASDPYGSEQQVQLQTIKDELERVKTFLAEKTPLLLPLRI